MAIQNLSQAQRAAVTHISGPAIVTAGAGSGKTRTLTNKIAYLVNDLNYDPAKILAITFTNKAAFEMKTRLQKVTGRPVADFPWVRTFHSACFQILKEHCELLGYRKPLLIHDDSQQQAHLKKVLAALDVDRKYLYPAASMISAAKNSGDPSTYLKTAARVPRHAEIYRSYNERLEQSNCVDFDDILLLSRQLLTNHPEIRERYRQAFDYILVDEFQDTNTIQNQVVDLLLRDGNLTVVGDDYQSIYRFRGADPFHFIHFPEKYEGASIFRLEENFRSTAQIVAAAESVIANNLRRIEKNCFSSREGEPVLLKILPDQEAEAEWVARKCRELASDRGIPLDQTAILYRTKFTSLPFERALRFARLPYTMVGAQGFFQRREVQDINSYLICAVNPRDDVSFERIVNVPRRGIGPAAATKIQAGKRGLLSLQEACRQAVGKNILPKKASAALGQLLDLLESLGREKPAEAIRRVLLETGYDEYLKSFSENADDFQNRRENVMQMMYDASRKETIAEYLEDAALIRDDQDTTDSGKGIRLSTIHAAKGLEFRAVFVVTLEEGILPHHRSVTMDVENESDEGIEEERRLMYVAMTRASDILILTGAANRRGEEAIPSRFLDELPASVRPA